MRANISGIEVEGTAEELGVLFRNYLTPNTPNVSNTFITSTTPTTSATSGLTCPACGMGGFRTQATVRMHVSHMKDEAHRKARGKKEVQRDLPCAACGNLFGSKRALGIHIGQLAKQRDKAHVEEKARRDNSSAAEPSSESDITIEPTPVPDPGETMSIKHYVFVCKVGPTEVRHPVDGTSPSSAIEAHDKANPNHRFVTALNKREDTPS